MKIIIVGAGFTGMQLAKRLISEKNDVVLIDENEETVRHASNRLDCMVMEASGNSLDTLTEAGIADADALVALTNSDEVNMITCSLVDSVYPNVLKIARVRNLDYYSDTTHLKDQPHGTRPLYGIDKMVYPDMEAASAIVAAFERGAVTSRPFENSDFELFTITIEEGSTFDGEPVQNLRKLVTCPFILAFVENAEESFIPSGATVLNADDRISVLTSRKNLKYFLELSGSKTKQLRKIALIGAGKIGSRVAAEILSPEKKSFFSKMFKFHHIVNQNFAIIDKDRALAKEAVDRFPDAVVYNADVTDEGFIEEENLASFDLIIAATRNHELNMVTSAYFKSLGVAKTICLVTTSGFASIAHNIGIDVAVPIKDAVVDSILSHLRGKGVTEIHTVSDGEYEVIELTVHANSRMIGKALKDADEHGSFLVLLVQKGDEAYQIPSGDTILEEDDSIIFVVHTDDSKRILALFGE